MGALDGRVAIITGAARGLGREHALLFASEGAKVVVNDLGGDQQGGGADATPAQQTVDDIRAMGGEAVVNGENVADWDGARRLVEQAIDTFGDLHVLVNNAGILRDRVIVNMTEDEWDSVVRVHLKGHFAPAHFAANYWRGQTKSGRDVDAAIVNTTSTSGLFSNPGQANYDAAKSGIATLTQVMAKELVRYGVRANAIAPRARTAMTADVFGDAPTLDDGQVDGLSPEHVVTLVQYLSSPASEAVNGQLFIVYGPTVTLVAAPTAEKHFTAGSDAWAADDLGSTMSQYFADRDPELGFSANALMSSRD
jgi:NAD(P)-dependent dehydrogenase (short-subunit alcohol dehydrogenase family)